MNKPIFGSRGFAVFVNKDGKQQSSIFRASLPSSNISGVFGVLASKNSNEQQNSAFGSSFSNIGGEFGALANKNSKE